MEAQINGSRFIDYKRITFHCFLRIVEVREVGKDLLQLRSGDRIDQACFCPQADAGMNKIPEINYRPETCIPLKPSRDHPIKPTVFINILARCV